jgi:hypothetical protein
VTATRERRLREAGLVEVRPGFGDGARVVLCTRMGLRAVLRGDLTTPVLSPGKLHHSSVVARVGAQLELAGHSVLSEREILARERAEGERVFSVERGNGSYHLPDLILLTDPPEAIEVELTDKSARRLDELMRAWRRSVAGRQFGRVRYLCSSQALPYVVRAVERTSTDLAVDIELLESGEAQSQVGSGLMSGAGC